MTIIHYMRMQHASIYNIAYTYKYNIQVENSTRLSNQNDSNDDYQHLQTMRRSINIFIYLFIFIYYINRHSSTNLHDVYINTVDTSNSI